MATEPNVEVLGFTVTLSLPDNFGEGYSFTRTHRYPTGHAWAGSFSHTTDHNEAEDALWSETHYSEASHHPWGQSATYELEAETPAEMQKEVEKLIKQVKSVIKRFPPK